MTAKQIQSQDRATIKLEVRGQTIEAEVLDSDQIAVLAMIYFEAEERQQLEKYGMEKVLEAVKGRQQELIKEEKTARSLQKINAATGAERRRLSGAMQRKEDILTTAENEEVNEAINNRFAEALTVRVAVNADLRSELARRLREIFPMLHHIIRYENGEGAIRLSTAELLNVILSVISMETIALFKDEEEESPLTAPAVETRAVEVSTARAEQPSLEQIKEQLRGLSEEERQQLLGVGA